ncbi:MAG: adenylosuccinate synthase [Desulfobacterota bacterium]|nr:adenylosuccinate synthase [Thermodesulfobacteriota bacterium]
MSNVVVIGTQWGDEGKGKIVDFLTPQADIVVRFQGGPNAGHTVVVGDKKTILHQIPSGILHPTTRCVIGNGVVLDLEQLLVEINELKKQCYFQNESALLISGNAHLIMPYHKQIDVARERRKGNAKIGTTGRGIGPAYEDKVSRCGIRVSDLLDDALFKSKVHENLEEKNCYLQHFFNESPLDPTDVIERYISMREGIVQFITDTSSFLIDAIRSNKKILFEGAQGALLDVDHGTYPFVTSSNTVAAQAAIGSGIGPHHLHVILGIAKAYTTRVGSGPFPTELHDTLGEMLRKKGGEFGATTGRPRRCGWFDIPLVRYAARINGLTHLALTKLDVLSGLKKIKICVGYRCKGEILEVATPHATVLPLCEPVYHECEGWDDDLSNISSFDDLPEPAKEYIKFIEHHIELPVIIISVGVKRNQIISLQHPFAL